MEKRKNKNVKSSKKGQKFNDRKSSCDVNREDRVNRTKDVNDPKWRMYSDLLGAQVASFPFTSFASKYDYPKVIGGSGVNQIPGHSYPGIMTIYLNPSMGYSDDETSAINQAARMLYTKLSANNMKTTQYAPQDVIICMASLGELVGLNAYIRRAFGYLGTTNVRNWYYPKSIITAMGIDYDDFVKNAGIYRARFNYVSAIASAIAFPGDFKYFASVDALFRNVYLDHSAGLAQTYMFNPSTVWVLNETTEGGSTLVTTKCCGTALADKRTMAAILDQYEQIINTLMTSSTLQYLYADVLKYVSNQESKLLRLPQIDDAYAIIPEYSEEVLAWVENMVVLGNPMTEAGTSTLVITKDNDVKCDAGRNMIVYKPGFTTEYNGFANVAREATIMFDTVLNFHTDNPSVEERISSTRLVPGVRQMVAISDGTAVKYYYQASLPDHYAVSFSVYGFNDAGDLALLFQFKPGFTISAVSGANTYTMNCFHRRPRIIFALGTNDKDHNPLGAVKYQHSTVELDNYTNVQKEALARIQDVAILSLYSI